MPRARNDLDGDIKELQDDADSDIDCDDEIQELIDDYRDFIREVDGDAEGETDESLAEPGVTGARDLLSPLTNGSEVLRLPRGYRSRNCTKRNHCHRLADEANGWSYEARESPPEQPVFQQEVGLQAPIDQNSTILDCVNLFFTPECWKLIKRETNRYAEHTKASLARRGNLKTNSFLTSWVPVIESELKKFFAIIFHMTLVKKESLDSYWSTNMFINTPFPGRVMSRQRFRAIYSSLHLNDNGRYIPRGEENYDAFFKLRPYFDMFVEQSKSVYLPDENLSIDRCCFRGVINKDKPDKYGMNILKLCDAETGYILQMVPYFGDSKTFDQIILQLMEGYLDKWHTVYMYRCFLSPTIMGVLWKHNTRAVGTLMQYTKELPQEWRHQELEANEMAFCHRGNLTACRWKDKLDVCLLSTKHAATWTEVDVRSKGGLTKRVKPNCVLDYNTNKAGVDLNDQYAAHYSLKRNSMKWWKKMFFHLVARATVNAYIIFYKSRTPGQRRIPFSTFLQSCGESLAEEGSDYHAEPSRSGPHVIDVTRLSGRHFLEPIPPTSSKSKPYKVCKVCADIGKARTGLRGRKETMYHCGDCKIPLCVNPCFKKYHTERDYTR